MEDKQVNVTEHSVVDVINCFNAVNGDWLLRLISSNGQFPREKISIISAIKLSMAYFYHKDIVWIPISLEEVLRVSKGAGLSVSDGLFSVKNLRGEGQYSDDLLLMGIEIANDAIKVHYYPIEVKIGDNTSTVINKAKKQAYKTRNYLEKHLIEVNDEEETRRFGKKMYRNFMMHLAIVSAEKLKLYDIWNEQNWDLIIDSDVRRKLLNDDYKIVNDLDELIGRGAVMSFKKGITFNDEAKEIEITKDELGAEYDEAEFAKGNKFLEIIFGESQGYNNIIKPMESIKQEFINGESDFEKEKLLAYSGLISKEHNTKVDFEVKEEKSTVGVKEEVAAFSEDKKSEIKVNISREPLTVLFGNNVKTGEEVKWLPTDTSKVMHSNTGIIGTMGTGKTQFTKSLITQIHENEYNNVNSTPIGILIFDYKGDYIKEDFVKATNAKVYDLNHLPFNPLSIFKTPSVQYLLPLFTANNLKETIGTAFNLGTIQQNILKDCIMQAYEIRGIKKGDNSTWSSQAPTIKDVYSIFSEREDIKEDKLFVALTDLVEYEIFEEDPNKTKSLFDIIDGVTVINLSGPYGENIQNLVVAITLDLFYSQMHMKGHSAIDGAYRELTKIILVDEADNFLSKNFTAIKKILKEGREFGVGTILSTQLLSHFSTGDNEYANYILTWIVHNVADLSNKDVKYIFNTQTKADDESVFSKIKTLEKHHSLIKLADYNRPIHLRDKAFWELIKS